MNKVRNQILTDIQGGESPKLAALASVALRMSIRNIIPCVIEDIHGGMSMCKVKMKVCEDQYLRSSVTLESRQLLDLKEGKSVLALFKASAATVSKENRTTAAAASSSDKSPGYLKRERRRSNLKAA